MLVNNFSVDVFDVYVSCCFVCHKFWHIHHSPVKLPTKNVKHIFPSIFQCENSTSSNCDKSSKWIKVSKISTLISFISFICAKISCFDKPFLSISVDYQNSLCIGFKKIYTDQSHHIFLNWQKLEKCKTLKMFSNRLEIIDRKSLNKQHQFAL